jgi:NitT/TauT family transport system ATP-binding protein
MELWTSGAIPTKAILMVSHNIEEAVFMADRVVVMDKEPGRIVSTLDIHLAHPRERKSAEFQAVVDQVFSILAGQTQPEAIELGTAPGEPGVTRGLPHIHIIDLSGLLEYLDELPDNRTDIYRLVETLGIDSDYLLLLTEAAELLGFVRIEKGDIMLTGLGETFAEARILARKEIFATRVRRLPLFRWLLSLLQASENRRLRWEVVKTALQLEFPPDETERQLETIIDWGRYAELLVYNDDEETLYLENVTVPT